MRSARIVATVLFAHIIGCGGAGTERRLRRGSARAAASDRASLSISDEGAGIAPDAAANAARSGHYGLLNMRQRAEQIGAGIDVRRPPSGGTTIRLSWSSA